MREFGGPSEKDMMWKADQPEHSEQVEQQITSGEKQYETREGEKVTLQWQIIQPEDGAESKDEVLVFLPGAAVGANSKSIINTAREAADASKLATYTITTRMEKAEKENSQSLQAEAIQQFIAEQHLNQVTLTGNSQGANKVGFVYHELRHNSPDISIRALLLDSPAGLIDQDGLKLTGNFLIDGTLKTGPDIIKNSKVRSIAKIKSTASRMGRAIQAGTDIGVGMAKELATAPTEFPTRALHEGKEAGTKNPYWNEVECPVVITIGNKDSAFKATEILPESSFNDKTLFKESVHDKTMEAQNLRGQIMKKTFPNSPKVVVLEGSKDSTHAMRFTRGKKVPSSSWHMLERIERELNKK